MATAADDRNVTDYPLDSPKSADNSHAAPDVPAITQEELMEKGSVMNPIHKEAEKAISDLAAAFKENDKKKPKAPKKELTEEEKKKKAAEKKKRENEKRKREHAAAMAGAAPVDNAPRYYYDIQNFIVTNGVDLEQFGVTPPVPPQSGVENTANGKRVKADCPSENLSSTGATISSYTYPGKTLVSAQSVFCPDCGLRIKKHHQGRGTYKGEICVVMHCPQELVA